VWHGEQCVERGSRERAEPRVRVLIADDNDTLRMLYMRLFGGVAGVSSLVAAEDGHDAVLIARRLRCQIAILDFNMPRLDGVDAALLLRRERPATRVAVQSSDPDSLEARATGLGLALFDKLEFERVLAWVALEVAAWAGRGPTTVAQLAPRRDFSCSSCGYGVVSREPPECCPMCQRMTSWHHLASEAPGYCYESS
jgi:CheY-like chemotaxis protein